jgi:hypothetical protein
MVEKSNGLGGGTADGDAARCCSSAGEGSSDLTAVFSSAAQTAHRHGFSILSSEIKHGKRKKHVN